MKNRNLATLLVLASILSSLACTPKKIASDITSQIMKGGSPAFEMEQDPALAEEAGLGLIKTMEVFHYDNPKNKNYMVLMSKSYATYALGFFEWNMLKYKNVDETKRALNEKRALMFYKRGKELGLEVLSRNGDFEKALTQDVDAFKKSLNGFGKKSVPALFWTAFNWGSVINLNRTDPMSIAELPKVEAIVERVLKLDPNFYYGGPNLFFGVSLGSRSAMFGGNPAKSKEHFEAALAAYQRKYLMTQVMYAQTYAVQNNDRALFESLLNEVLNTATDILPAQRLANELAHERARWLLDNANTIFANAGM